MHRQWRRIFRGLNENKTIILILNKEVVEEKNRLYFLLTALNTMWIIQFDNPLQIVTYSDLLTALFLVRHAKVLLVNIKFTFN